MRDGGFGQANSVGCQAEYAIEGCLIRAVGQREPLFVVRPRDGVTAQLSVDACHGRTGQGREKAAFGGARGRAICDWLQHAERAAVTASGPEADAEQPGGCGGFRGLAHRAGDLDRFL